MMHRIWLLPIAMALVAGLRCGNDRAISPPEAAVLEGDFAFDARQSLEELARWEDGFFYITGSLLIVNTDLETLEGLEKLTGIGGSLEIRFNPSLRSLRGLDHLTSVGDSLADTGQNALLSLPKPTHVVEGLLITDNESLTSLAGLHNLAFVGGGLSFIFNSSLQSMQPLNHLRRIRGSVDFLSNYALSTLEGLHNLERIEGYLDIDDNQSLTTLNGLNGLVHIERDLIIRFNDVLTSLAGLSALAILGGQATIDNNAALPDSLVQAFVAQIDAEMLGNRLIHPTELREQLLAVGRLLGMSRRLLGSGRLTDPHR